MTEHERGADRPVEPASSIGGGAASSDGQPAARGCAGETPGEAARRTVVRSVAAGCALGTAAAALAVVAIVAAMLSVVGVAARLGTGGTVTPAIDAGILAGVAVAAAAASLGLTLAIVIRCLR